MRIRTRHGTRRRGGARAAVRLVSAAAVVGSLLSPIPVSADEEGVEAYPRPGTTSRISDLEGLDVDGPSDNPSISADGRYAAFLTNATDLVPDDRNGSRTDVIVADLLTGEFVRVSVSTDGEQGNHTSRYPSITPDGRFVVFQSDSTNLVPGDTNQSADVFVHDRDADEDGTFDESGAVLTERVSVATGGKQARSGVRRTGGSDVGPPSISPDGGFVAFPSWSDDLVPEDRYPGFDLFLHDRAKGTTELVSVSTGGVQANSGSGTHYERGAGTSLAPVVTEGGREVVFWSAASNLVAGDTNRAIDVFIRDRVRQTTARLSTTASGEQADGPSFDPAITPDGRYVAFTSSASNLVPVDDPRGTILDYDTFVRDRDANADGVLDQPGRVRLERVSVASDGSEADGSYSGQAAMSGDGRYVTFASDAKNLVPGDTNGQFDVFLRDRQLRTTERISTSSDHEQAESYSWLSAVSADGRYVAFDTSASGLTPTFRRESYDVLMRDRGPSIGIGRLQGSNPAGVVRLDGSATFSGAVMSAALDATDDADGTSGWGVDLQAADLTYRAEQQDLLIRLEPDGLPRTVLPCCVRLGAAGTPVIYGFELLIDGRRFQLRARAPAHHAASFYLYTCDSVCTGARTVRGSFGTTEEEILISVPLAALGAREGSAVHELRAFATAGDDGPQLDELELPAAEIPERQLSIGLAPQGTSPEEVRFEDVSSALQAGLFSVDTSAAGLAPGLYNVVAQACLADRCGSRTTSVQVGEVVPAQPTGDIAGLAVEVGSESLRVTGRTELSEEVVLATDPVDPHKVVPGSDLTAARITFKNPQTLVFTLDVANLGPLNGVPENLRYAWEFTVTPPYAGAPGVGRYELMALRSKAAQPERMGNLEPTFTLYDSFGTGSTFTPRFKRELAGKLGEGVVQWEVPLREIGGKPGVVVSAVEYPTFLFGSVPDSELGGVTVEHVVPSPVEGSSYNRALPPLDHVKELAEYEVPEATVTLGIAEHGVPDDEVKLTTKGNIAMNGFLRGDLPLPTTPGKYKVLARACLRDHCVIGSTTTVVEAVPQPTEGFSTRLTFSEGNAKAGHFSDEVFLHARLTDGDNQPMAAAPVVFELQRPDATVSVDALTDADGNATAAWHLHEPPGPYRLTVRYAGSDIHAAAADVAGFVIERENISMTLDVEGRGNDGSLIARLLDQDDPEGGGVGGRSIAFYADDRWLGAAETDATGIARLVPTGKYRNGRHLYQAEFAGDAFFRRSSAQKGPSAR